MNPKVKCIRVSSNNPVVLEWSGEDAKNVYPIIEGTMYLIYVNLEEKLWLLDGKTALRLHLEHEAKVKNRKGTNPLRNQTLCLNSGAHRQGVDVTTERGCRMIFEWKKGKIAPLLKPSSETIT